MSTEHKIILGREPLKERLTDLSRPIVFTNGCFDILHRGHISYLEEIARFGPTLIVGVNSDKSVRRLNKSNDRPVNPLADRMALLAALQCVTVVVPFDEDTPLTLIQQIQPDHLAKGGDWQEDEIIGAVEVRSWGGQVHSIPFRYQRSTTRLIQRLKNG